ncbi:MAG: hypothetical protein UT64_C0041G0014 [Candidatus Falkowbacteria bacterium GW2011_GWF2_39_8]|uniref:Uncharacterized protein n=1 Tax=Candidatus Falkowbacteria bacterium GW2011_GWF2_39_8 TaxID=1618642 RepID=A0A0G0SBQ4_9BACT|nr:MAG: hypothetical protein UT64_C0041G0014 [Candidatus Falkowbacteria bacterium GW2011_GWF2_39_8]
MRIIIQYELAEHGDAVKLSEKIRAAVPGFKAPIGQGNLVDESAGQTGETARSSDPIKRPYFVLDAE